MFNIKKEELISFLSDNHPKSFLALAQKFDISRDDNHEFGRFLYSLVDEKILFLDKNKDFYTPKLMGIFEGEIKINAKKFGFVDVEIDNEIKGVFISKQNLGSAMYGDTVEVHAFQENFKDEIKYFGFVSKIIERKTKTILGWIQQKDVYFDFVPYNEKHQTSFYKFEEGQDVKDLVNKIVKVDVVDFKSNAVIIKLDKVIGQLDDAFAEINLVVENSGVDSEFPDEVDKESDLIPNDIEDKDGEFSKRHDLRNELVVTIDGDDTKDYDDAFSLKKDGDNFILGIHIADVSYYVKENSEIDIEALKRGTSIYLVDRVIPMLPKKLSNGICSLNPNVDRFTMTIELKLDKNGNTIEKDVYASIIESKYRLTYNQVNDYYAKNEKNILTDPKLQEMLDIAFDLNNILKGIKQSQGYVDFEIEEPKIELDEKGKTKAIVTYPRGISEVVIENFMVRANEEVAKFMTEANVPTLYRIHEIPSIEKVDRINDVLKLLNLKAKFKEGDSSIGFSKVFEGLKEERFDDLIKLMILRSMQKAEYSPINKGHFGLGSEFYLHFTSPIRRYPDLIVHRIIREVMFKKNDDVKSHFKTILPVVGKQTSACEVKAFEVEREVLDVKKAEFYEDKIGQSEKATIVTILQFGMFVEFSNKVDALIHIDNLLGDTFKQIGDGNVLKGNHATYTIGDVIDVTIVSANRLARKIDVVLTKDYPEWLKLSKEKKSNHDERSHNDGGSRGGRSNNSDRRGGRSFGGRSYNSDRRGGRSFGDRPRGDRPFNDRPRSDRPFGERSNNSDRPRGDRPFNDRPRGDRPFNDRPRSDRPFGERSNNGDRPRGDRPFGDRPRGDRPFNDRPRSDRPFGDRPRGDRPFNDRPRGDRPFGDRPRGDRPFNGRPRSDRPFGERSNNGDRPRGDRPFNDRSDDNGNNPFRPDRPRSNKPNNGDKDK